MDHPIQARKPEEVLINKKERSCHPMDFAIKVDDKVKTKDNKSIDEFLDIA